MKAKSFFLLLLFNTSISFSAPAELVNRFGPQPMDGVYIEALQNYNNILNHHVGFDFGVWPIQPYYNGFSLNFDYTYYFNKDRAWEILNLSYIYTVDTGLTTELADVYEVDPKSIERLSYVISSNYLITLAYGKFIFFEDYIRYFRNSLIIGPALVGTNQKSYLASCVGWSFETLVSEKLSWKFEIRHHYILGDMNHPNNLAFNLGTSYSF